MTTNESVPWALGLMSGTSMDGIDVAAIRTDGKARVETGGYASYGYDRDFRERLRGVLGGRGPVAEVERALTLRHVEAVRAFLKAQRLTPDAVSVIGFHGHTILHEPERRRTWQIGDGALLAESLRIDVVGDLRGRDVAEGGQGAPLAPLYHAALAHDQPRPLVVLNLGGVANVTWIGPGTTGGAAELVAFDTGPANALLDDWAERWTGTACDTDGALARRGRVDERALAVLLDHPYFALPAPKSLDRDAFAIRPLDGLGAEDGAATLTAFTAATVALARAHFPLAPLRWLVTGGGRQNPVLMAALRERLRVPVEPVEAAGWNGDAIEAQAFAYLAVRSLQGLPLSLPGTTGVPRPTSGGTLFRARAG